MNKYIPGNQKLLALEIRIYIENELNKGTSFKDIARFLCKGSTTISKEVKAHRLSDWYYKGTFFNAKNFCAHRYHCKKTNACRKIILCGISRESKKTLLTFFFPKEKLFLAFLMKRCTRGAIRLVFDHLGKRLGTYEFLCLSIFSQTAELNLATQKLLKQEYLTQWDVNLIVNHINSTPRKSLHGKTPYEAALKSFGGNTLKSLQLKRISPNEVNLTPKLIRFNR